MDRYRKGFNIQKLLFDNCDDLMAETRVGLINTNPLSKWMHVKINKADIRHGERRSISIIISYL